MTSQSRIIFLDVDGTILAHGESIAPSTIAAVRAARERGHLVYLCTGRAAGDINPRVLDIGFDGAISNGGALAVSGDETVLAELMPRAAVERVMAYFDEQGTRYFIQSHAGVYASEGVRSFIADFISERRRRHAEDLSTVALAEDVVAAPRFAPVEEADLDHIAKAVFVSSDPDAVEKTQRALGDEFHVIPGSMPLPTGSNGEVGMRGTNKGTGIQAMLSHLGRDAADAIGIGDSWNDVEMFEVCGTAIAMAEADPHLQRIAGEVTTGVLDDGIWNAFVRHGIIDPETAA
ncbi:haloacid dehalogenase [Microbacterium arborescens]|uniref:Cof subfamily protein (Haloacid dehalogenase superfamily) n=2 Tax=Microbacterium TaxID=33882 RepID=A0ABU1I4H7_9MICO|nr:MULTISPECIES: Cof-type HAD-IIB family hydrolase [Microbacterium]MDR6168417.1 Cof subfamily protein (haloacid dehalogenase superfamily) [Microbacterium paludicola]OAZ40050.1 haloacid dehalogenase [Microbacterium arborescens]QCR39369.1 Cof-type HAD-IIB family hydrolase [Microbacterium sp. SGAir0570]